jgi:hypothetical protein
MPSDIELMARAVEEIKRLRAANEHLGKAVAATTQIPHAAPIANAADRTPWEEAIARHRVGRAVMGGTDRHPGHDATPLAKALAADAALAKSNDGARPRTRRTTFQALP